MIQRINDADAKCIKDGLSEQRSPKCGVHEFLEYKDMDMSTPTPLTFFTLQTDTLFTRAKWIRNFVATPAGACR